MIVRTDASAQGGDHKDDRILQSPCRHSSLLLASRRSCAESLYWRWFLALYHRTGSFAHRHRRLALTLLFLPFRPFLLFLSPLSLLFPLSPPFLPIPPFPSPSALLQLSHEPPALWPPSPARASVPIGLF